VSEQCVRCLRVREALQEARHTEHTEVNSKFNKFKSSIQIPNDEANFTNLHSEASQI
jgi:hypothetical protein